MSASFGQKQFQRRQYKHKASDMDTKAVNYDALREKVKLPAYGLILTAGLSLLLTIGGLGFGVTYSAVQADLFKEQIAESMFGPVELPENLQSKQAQRAAEKVIESRKSQAQMVVTLIVGGVIIGALVLSVVYMIALVGGVMMMRFRNYKLVRISCIMALIPLVSPLVVLGIPFGIWGLARLSQNEIRQAFN